MNTNNIIYNLKALYWANDGHFSPSSPLKMYHGFMIEKITEKNSPKLKQLAWIIAHVATGVLAYPVLGLFAALDMAVKLLNWHLCNKGENEESFNVFKNAFRNTHGAPLSGFTTTFDLIPNGEFVISPIFKSFREYNVTFGPEKTEGEFATQKEELKTEIEAFFKEFTKAYTRVYYAYDGSWEHGLKIQFCATESMIPYCSNPLLPPFRLVNFPYPYI